MNQAEQLALAIPAIKESWNGRYVAYSHANGMEPGAMLAHDRQRLPGGCMAGFMIWISTRWREFRKLRGIRHDYPLGHDDHEQFDRWLAFGAPLLQFTP